MELQIAVRRQEQKIQPVIHIQQCKRQQRKKDITIKLTRHNGTYKHTKRYVTGQILKELTDNITTKDIMTSMKNKTHRTENEDERNTQQRNNLCIYFEIYELLNLSTLNILHI
jgi:hypothetical protein